MYSAWDAGRKIKGGGKPRSYLLHISQAREGCLMTKWTLHLGKIYLVQYKFNFYNSSGNICNRGDDTVPI